jgi:hypothetical protein
MSIGKTKIIGFSPARIKKEAEEYLVSVQTEKLIEYAKEEIVKLGDKIQTYNSQNHMDRSGHLLNSLCWGVAYNGKLVDSGFYRGETLKSHTTWNEKDTTNSYLHEWLPEYEAFQVQGRQLAEQYIRRYGTAGSQGGHWRVFFAILAPYWGYWESGFNMVHGKGKNKRTSFRQFAVMAQLYDEVSNDLKPAKTKFEVTKDIAYVKPYYIKFKNGKESRVRGSIERKYDSWMSKQKKL